MNITKATTNDKNIQMTFDEATRDVETFVVRIFAQLFELGGGKVEHYYGDFARDVFWLQRNFQAILDGQAFFFGVRETGTSIGFDSGEVRGMNTHTWSVGVVQVEKWGGRWLHLLTRKLA